MRRLTTLFCLASLLCCPATFADPSGGKTANRIGESVRVNVARSSAARCLSGSTVERFDDQGLVAATGRSRKCLV